MAVELIILVLVVVTALAFEFTNDFHDTGTAMATLIATGALKPKVAVELSALSNLIGAILWNLLTWLFGLPSSFFRALFGGLIGAGLAAVFALGTKLWSMGTPRAPGRRHSVAM